MGRSLRFNRVFGGRWRRVGVRECGEWRERRREGAGPPPTGEGNEQPGIHHAGRSEGRGRGDGEGNPLQGQGFRGGVQVPGDRREGDRKAVTTTVSTGTWESSRRG